jgi:hypothetical protein|tara:strand:+ start:222 stop:470 length:249 start_codon:yes stop_codon:yes gene_type:complete
MKRIKNMISFIRKILLSISGLFLDIAAALPGIKRKDNDDPKYLGGGASTEVPQSFHVDRNKGKRGRPKGATNEKKSKASKRK